MAASTAKLAAVPRFKPAVGTGGTTMVVTVNAALAVLPAEVAVMVAVPGATPVAMPVGKIVATIVVPEVQLTVVVILALLPSEYVPVAT